MSIFQMRAEDVLNKQKHFSTATEFFFMLKVVKRVVNCCEFEGGHV